MTDEQQPQGQGLADATEPESPGVEAGQGDAPAATPPAAPEDQAPPGVDTGTDQPGSEEATIPDPSGVDAGETTSVPTLRGPGPEDEVEDAAGEPGDV